MIANQRHTIQYKTISYDKASPNKEPMFTHQPSGFCQGCVLGYKKQVN